MTWSAEQYSRFEDERTRPVRDLLARIPDIAVRSALDLGCGPGHSTEVLASRFPGAAVRGLDSSSDMLAAARRRLPQLRFDLGDLENWLTGPVAGDDAHDLILANAVLHWVPDHARVFPALKDRLAAGGCLAVQMPDNLDEPAHCAMREVAAQGPWAARLAAVAGRRSSLAPANAYVAWLRSADCTVDIWRTTYYHVLGGGAAAIVDWFSGSGLRPFIEPLDDVERTVFLARYQAAVSRAYPLLADGCVLLAFPRLFLVVRRGS